MGIFEDAVRDDGFQILLHLRERQHASGDRIPGHDGDDHAVRPNLRTKEHEGT